MLYVLGSVSGSVNKQKQYHLGERTVDSICSSLALACLLNEKHHTENCHLHLCLTDATRESLDRTLLREEAERLELGEVHFQVFDRSDSIQSTGRLFEEFKGISSDDNLVLDVTEAWGFFSLLLFGAIGYYRKVVGVEAAIYGADPTHSEEESTETHAFEDLSWLFDLEQFSGALEQFFNRENGDLLASQLQTIHEETYRKNRTTKSQTLQNLSSIVEMYGRFVNAGLCLEAGLSTEGHGDEYWDEVREDINNLVPYLSGSIAEIRNMMEEIAVPKEVKDKEKIELNESELRRQIEVGNRLVRTGNFPPAYLLARELLVNAYILGDRESVPGSEWLDPDVRDLHSGRFYMLNHWMVEEELRPLLSDFQQFVSSTWAALKQRRNVLAHISMNPERVRIDRMTGNLRELWDDVVTLALEERERLPEMKEFSFSGTSLLFPYGSDHRTALRKLIKLYDVNKLFVMVSEDEDRKELKELLEDHRLQNSVVYLTFANGGKDFQRWQEYWQENRKNLLQSSQILVSVSGGTAEMKYVAERVLDRIRNYGVPWKEVGFSPETPQEGLQGEISLVEIRSSTEGDHLYP